MCRTWGANHQPLIHALPFIKHALLRDCVCFRRIYWPARSPQCMHRQVNSCKAVANSCAVERNSVSYRQLLVLFCRFGVLSVICTALSNFNAEHVA